MKKAIRFIIVLFCILGICFIVWLITYFLKYGYETPTHEIFENCYFENVDSDKQSIYFYTDEKGEDRVYIAECEYIIKYASNEKNIVAYHYNQLSTPFTPKGIYKRTIGGVDYDVFKDGFIIYDLTTKEKHFFDSQESFLEYCEVQKIYLTDWSFSKYDEYEKIDLGNNWSIISSDSIYVPDQVLKGNKVIYEGYISNLRKNENTAIFRLEIPQKSMLEFPLTSNINLILSDNAVEKYEFGDQSYEDIFYDKIISLNTLTDEINQSQSD